MNQVISKLKPAWTFLSKNVASNIWVLPIYATLIIGLLFVYSVYSGIKNPLVIPTQTVKIVPEVRYVNQPIQYKTIEVPVKIVIPTDKQEKKLELDFKYDEKKDLLTGIFNVPALPSGATAISVIDKITGEQGISFKPGKQKIFGGKWFVDAGTRTDFKSYDLSAGKYLAQIGPVRPWLAVYGSKTTDHATGIPRNDFGIYVGVRIEF